MAIIALCLAIVAALNFWSQNAWVTSFPGGSRQMFGNTKFGLSRSSELRPEDWFQWASGKGNFGHEHVPAYSWESPDDSDTDP